MPTLRTLARSTLVLAALLLALMAGTACRPRASQLVVVIDSDLAVAGATGLRRVHVAVLDYAGSTRGAQLQEHDFTLRDDAMDAGAAPTSLPFSDMKWEP